MVEHHEHSGDVLRLARRAREVFASGDLGRAESVLAELLARAPDDSAANQMLAIVLIRTGREREAEAHLANYLERSPNDPAAHTNLGELYRRQGKPDLAAQSFEKALRLAPALAEAHFNLGNALKVLGRHEEAVQSFRRAVELKPDYAKARYNLANALLEDGHMKSAVAEYRTCLELDPNWQEAHLNLANAYSELGELDKAIAHYKQILPGDPSAAPSADDLQLSLGHAYFAQGDIPRARSCYLRHFHDHPGAWLASLRADCLCEPIAPAAAYIDEACDRIQSAVAEAAERALPVEPQALHAIGAEPPMAMVYFGRDVRPLMSQFAALFGRLGPDEPPSLGSGKPRVGVVVTHGHEGVFARCLGGLIERLSRERLEVEVLCSRSGANVLRHMMPGTKLSFFVLPRRIDEAAAQIRAARFDVLYYWEVGTDAANYFLPFFRPAPLQVACWGWPATTGNPNITHYITGRLLEPAGGERHYTERTVQFENLPTWYENPLSEHRSDNSLPAKLKSREELGLGSREHLYLCTQNLRKVHPDFDALIADLLTADPAGRLLVIADAQPAITEKLLGRWRRAMPVLVGRIQVLPRMEREVYLNVVALADVVVDTLHYGGGANTVLDACAVGTPIVSLPGPFHRGRWTSAVYSELGIPETIVSTTEGYVNQAVRVATDRDFREHLSHRIKRGADALFRNDRAVAEHEAFLVELVHSARQRD